LQRLADPNRPHHPIANPYLTVDWNMLDLQVINSEKDAGGAAEEQDIKTSNMRFASRSWKNVTGNFSHLWDRTLSATELADSKAGLGNLINFSAGFEPNRLVPQHTFGVQNFSVNSAGEAAPYAETPEKPFLHFPWHDAPLSNTYELMLVPASAPSRFGIESHDNGEAFFNSSGQCRFRDPHQNRNLYLNFFQAGGLRDIFDYVRVPSRFAGTVDAMREPGKINLNTLTEKGWETLKGNRSSFPAYADLQSKRPFETPQQTLLDSSPATSTPPPLFKPQDNTDNPYVNPYTALEHIMRLADVTTTRSNVFAVWITVGYFDCEQDGRNLGKEKGLSDGLAKRHRAFYLIDRSVPVGFRRGEKLNTGNVVIKRTILE
jgi:hypothetical protein